MLGPQVEVMNFDIENSRQAAYTTKSKNPTLYTPTAHE